MALGTVSATIAGEALCRILIIINMVKKIRRKREETEALDTVQATIRRKAFGFLTTARTELRKRKETPEATDALGTVSATRAGEAPCEFLLQ